MRNGIVFTNLSLLFKVFVRFCQTEKESFNWNGKLHCMSTDQLNRKTVLVWKIAETLKSNCI